MVLEINETSAPRKGPYVNVVLIRPSLGLIIFPLGFGRGPRGAGTQIGPKDPGAPNTKPFSPNPTTHGRLLPKLISLVLGQGAPLRAKGTKAHGLRPRRAHGCPNGP